MPVRLPERKWRIWILDGSPLRLVRLEAHLTSAHNRQTSIGIDEIVWFQEWWARCQKTGLHWDESKERETEARLKGSRFGFDSANAPSTEANKNDRIWHSAGSPKSCSRKRNRAKLIAWLQSSADGILYFIAHLFHRSPAYLFFWLKTIFHLQRLSCGVQLFRTKCVISGHS